jgi:hypothetical protein
VSELWMTMAARLRYLRNQALAGQNIAVAVCWQCPKLQL